MTNSAKTSVVTIAGALTVVILLIASQFDVKLTGEQGSAIAFLITAGAAAFGPNAD